MKVLEESRHLNKNLTDIDEVLITSLNSLAAKNAKFHEVKEKKKMKNKIISKIITQEFLPRLRNGQVTSLILAFCEF